jgi:hypothetical protein
VDGVDFSDPRVRLQLIGISLKIGGRQLVFETGRHVGNSKDIELKLVEQSRATRGTKQEERTINSQDGTERRQDEEKEEGNLTI